MQINTWYMAISYLKSTEVISSCIKTVLEDLNTWNEITFPMFITVSHTTKEKHFITFKTLDKNKKVVYNLRIQDFKLFALESELLKQPDSVRLYDWYKL